MGVHKRHAFVLPDPGLPCCRIAQKPSRDTHTHARSSPYYALHTVFLLGPHDVCERAQRTLIHFRIKRRFTSKLPPRSTPTVSVLATSRRYNNTTVTRVALQRAMAVTKERTKTQTHTHTPPTRKRDDDDFFVPGACLFSNTMWPNGRTHTHSQQHTHTREHTPLHGRRATHTTRARHGNYLAALGLVIWITG